MTTSFLENFKYADIIKTVIGEFELELYDGYHGLAHWMRVIHNGLLIANKNNKVDPLVVVWFGIIHDCKRMNEDDDPYHGERAGRFIESNRELFPLTDHQLDKLIVACKGHQTGIHHQDETVMACWCADRLDLPRVGKTVEKIYLGLEESWDLIPDCTIRAFADEWCDSIAKELKLL